MRNIKLIIVMQFAILSCASPLFGQSSKGYVPKDGQEDRKFWVKTLEKLLIL